jgi:DNA-directed RNA polymerase specialized sigma24 family protein
LNSPAEAALQHGDDDRRVMQAFCDGDESAFDVLFRRWSGRVLRFLERMIREPAVAEELLQETFLRVSRAREKWEPSSYPTRSTGTTRHERGEEKMTRDRNGRGPGETLDERLSAWLDGELDAAAEAELRAELEAHPALAARLAQLQRVDEALRALPEPAVRPELEAQLRERIAGEDGRKTQRRRRPGGRGAPSRRRRWTVPVLAAAAAAAFALLALPRLRETPSPEETPFARTPTPRSTPKALEPQPLPGPPLEPAPAPEELALAVEVESDADLEVIEMLDWLETLGEIESS